ncbi:chloramphenicol phosphotransferase CPT [Kitasatospora cheerisanensis]|uniref:Chloramphenicol phosphotransferase n=1 Tax=Kitasatospora cheerisanensis KCTC 2395 TaxID=1348663 RepID=A0A066YT74_9ACTN|nr:chloramphenicol phosphotransferase CPT [Kitasatospora cheerisanensis]KDN81130.1 chloramphenicol phosphotransferase [Kitasatospora cheerisanensis KCTC 2395]
MTIRVIVLNGGSSSGKSSLARALQAQLPEPWLTFGIDDLIAAMPPALLEGGGGIELGEGVVTVGDAFRRLEGAWMAGVAATARAGAPVVADDVFLSGPASQQRWRTALSGLDVLWVGVRCDPDQAAARERARPDRTPGMAADQALRVHDGVHYDLEVDTTRTPPAACARTIADRLGG